MAMIENSHALLLTTPEAARALAISPRTLWTLTKRGEIPSVKIGRAVRYDPRDLLVWIDARKTGSAAAVENA
jgi:excisionase family DNA binding protein